MNFLMYCCFVTVLTGLKEKYAEAMNRDDVKAIVLTGKNCLRS